MERARRRTNNQQHPRQFGRFIERAMRGHVLANAELIGTYQKGDR